MTVASALRSEVAAEFETSRMHVLSVLAPRKDKDQFLQQLWDRLDKLSIEGPVTLLQARLPKGQFMSRDTTAMGQGFRTPPHVSTRWGHECEPIVPNLQTPQRKVTRRTLIEGIEVNSEIGRTIDRDRVQVEDIDQRAV